MSFNKSFLPDYEILLERIEKNPEQVFKQYYRVDAFMGPAKSTLLISAFLGQYDTTSNTISETFIKEFTEKHGRS